MDYNEAIEFLFAQVPMFQNLGAGAYKPGLDTTLALASHWGDPHKKIKAFIHVGGTNGKGSTAHTLAAVLQSAGYRTGLYTSPHLLDFRERIRVDGEMADKEFVTRFVEEFRADESLTSLQPTFFELTTVMAFRYFADADVDVAVIEVGLGGRLDCTNIITPQLSVITNISLDHTALLGHTEEAIANEKAGIIKPGVPVVVGRAAQGSAVRKVFENRAEECGSELTIASDTGIPDFWGPIEPELKGACQKENTATIAHALAILRRSFPRIDTRAVQRGFANVCKLTGLAGRWTEIEKEPVRVICDTGHNIGGWEYLGPTLSAIASASTLHMVLGFVNDKDVAAIMECMPHRAVYYFATPSVRRGRPAEETAEFASGFGLHGNAFASVAEAYDAAWAAAVPGDTIFVGGSTFVVADFLAAREALSQKTDPV